MNKTKQFWAVLKFQIACNPFVLLFVAALGMHYIPYLTGGHGGYSDFRFLLWSQDLFFVGILGFALLAPEISRPATINSVTATGTDFLLTRAVDRYIVFRARSALYCFLILVIPLCALLVSLGNPILHIRESDPGYYRQALNQIPGSIPAPPEPNGRADGVTIPDGQMLIASFHLCLILCAAIGTAAFVYLIYPLKYRQLILWGTFLAAIVVPDFIVRSETVFFFYVAHQGIFWLVAILACCIGHIWCERRFARLEQ